ncbi:MAG: hypothetical protein HY907_11375 [Deltaproteobacteria bacterium]|nr:hypothetical protein [Deltaproteobacteria bacterium]
MTFSARRWMVALVIAGLALRCRIDGEDGSRESVADPTAANTPPAPAMATRGTATAPPTAAAMARGTTTGPGTATHPTTATPSASGTVAPATPGTPAGITTLPPPAVTILGLDVHPIDATGGEDGRGNRVPAVRPVALDVRAEAWGGRALDPVLEVGDLRFHHYSHPEIGVLRYVAADLEALPAGAPVSVRWRGDGRDRIPVVQALQVAP